MHKLLIEMGLDEFTVIELRDEALHAGLLPQDADEMRKKIYRQILRFQRLGWLTSQGSGRRKRYSVTSNLSNMKLGRLPKVKDKMAVSQSVVLDITALHDNVKRYKAELEITLGEIEEYHLLHTKLPKLKKVLANEISKANSYTTSLLGKIKATEFAIESLKADAAC
jgi:hypothetical protein